MTRIEARHPGVCGECEERFQVGTKLRRNEEDTAWVHDACPDSFDGIDLSNVCPECFMVRAVNGGCSCP